MSFAKSHLAEAVILPPAMQAIGFNRTFRAQTIAGAYDWFRRNAPGDATIMIECRNLVMPPGTFKGHNVRQLRQMTYEQYVEQGADYVVASSQCYGPYFEHPDRHPREYGEYQQLFSRMREVARFTPPRGYPWPELIVFKVVP